MLVFTALLNIGYIVATRICKKNPIWSKTFSVIGDLSEENKFNLGRSISGTTRDHFFLYGMASTVSRVEPYRKLWDQWKGTWSFNTSFFFVDRSFATFARTLDKYSFRLFAESCNIICNQLSSIGYITSTFYKGAKKLFGRVV